MLNPSSIDTLCSKASLSLHMAKNISEICQLVERAERIKPGSFEVLLLKGSLFHHKDYSDQLGAFRNLLRAFRIQPYNVELLHTMGSFQKLVNSFILHDERHNMSTSGDE